MIWQSERILNVRVIDGDTIKVELDLGFAVKCKQTLRFSRVNTPERRQPGYEEAKLYVQDKLSDLSKVKIVTYKQGKYGRYLCDVFVSGANLNKELLDKKLAKEYGNLRRKK